MLHGKTVNTQITKIFNNILSSYFNDGIYFRVQYGSNLIPKSSPIIQHYLMINFKIQHVIFIVQREFLRYQFCL